MNMLAIRAAFEPIREIAFGAISANYAAVGAALSYPVRIVRYVNMTNVDVYFSINETNNQVRLTSGSFLLLDVTTNREIANKLDFSVGTVFYVKAVSALPASGSCWIETLYAS